MWIRVLHWASRLFLAGIFVYAGYTKTALADPFAPYQFEMAVSAYELLPAQGAIFVARTLPWLEIALGVLLLVGWKLGYFASFAALLLGTFITMMGITYARGIEVSCGCFGLGEPITPATLTRDALLFALAVFVAVYAWRGATPAAATPDAPHSTPS